MQETNDKELQSLQNLTSHFLLTDEVEEETDPDKMGFLKKLEWKAKQKELISQKVKEE